MSRRALWEMWAGAQPVDGPAWPRVLVEAPGVAQRLDAGTVAEELARDLVEEIAGPRAGAQSVHVPTSGPLSPPVGPPVGNAQPVHALAAWSTAQRPGGPVQAAQEALRARGLVADVWQAGAWTLDTLQAAQEWQAAQRARISTPGQAQSVDGPSWTDHGPGPDQDRPGCPEPTGGRPPVDVGRLTWAPGAQPQSVHASTWTTGPQDRPGAQLAALLADHLDQLTRAAQAADDVRAAHQPTGADYAAAIRRARHQLATAHSAPPARLADLDAPTVYRITARQAQTWAAATAADVRHGPPTAPAAWWAPAGTPAPSTAPPTSRAADVWQPLDDPQAPALVAARYGLTPVDLVTTGAPHEVDGARIAGEPIRPRPEPDQDPHRRTVADALAHLDREPTSATPEEPTGPAQWDRIRGAQLDRARAATAEPTSAPRTAQDVDPRPVTPDQPQEDDHEPHAGQAEPPDDSPRIDWQRNTYTLRLDPRTVVTGPEPHAFADYRPSPWPPDASELHPAGQAAHERAQRVEALRTRILAQPRTDPSPGPLPFIPFGGIPVHTSPAVPPGTAYLVGPAGSTRVVLHLDHQTAQPAQGCPDGTCARPDHPCGPVCRAVPAQTAQEAPPVPVHDHAAPICPACGTPPTRTAQEPTPSTWPTSWATGAGRVDLRPPTGPTLADVGRELSRRHQAAKEAPQETAQDGPCQHCATGCPRCDARAQDSPQDGPPCPDDGEPCPTDCEDRPRCTADQAERDAYAARHAADMAHLAAEEAAAAREEEPRLTGRTLHLGSSRLYAAPLGTPAHSWVEAGDLVETATFTHYREPDDDQPEPCPMAPYEPPATLTWPGLAKAMTATFTVTTPNDAQARRGWLRLMYGGDPQEQRAARIRRQAGRDMRQARQRAARARRGHGRDARG